MNISPQFDSAVCAETLYLSSHPANGKSLKSTTFYQRIVQEGHMHTMPLQKELGCVQIHSLWSPINIKTHRSVSCLSILRIGANVTLDCVF